MPENSVDFAVFSPPFPALFAYSDSEADVGNVDQLGDESQVHFRFFFRRLARVLKPGRVAIVHVMQIPALKRTGTQGLFDFRGLLIRLANRSGLVYDYDWLIRKNPQVQAVRTHSHRLQFQTLGRDRVVSSGALGDYLLKFLKPGDNAVPVNEGGPSNDEWINWAEPAWTDIRETDVLNGLRGLREAKGEKDTKHICPLQLGVIERCVKLYTNPGEIVFSPFAGIGSELYMALKLGRRAYGCELKQEYFEQAKKNCRRAEEDTTAAKQQKALFD